MKLPHILIGERDPFMRRALENVLLPHFELTFVEDGENLIHHTRIQLPNLIILEALLPHKDGFQVCRELKSDPATRHIPILCFTFLLAEERAHLAGADAFLLKPLRPDLFLNTVHRLLHSEKE
jgi:CheY-like chemotaxis protein